MNNTFDWTRFKKIVAMDFRGMWPRFGMSMLIITLIPAAIWIFCTLLNFLPSVNISISPLTRWFFLGATVVICLIMAPSRMFKTCNLPKDGIYYAMLPASHLEKFCSQLLFCVIVCPFLCLLAGVVADLFLTLLQFGPYHEWIWSPLRHLSSLGPDLAAISEEDAEALEIIKFGFGWFVVACILSYLCDSATFMFTNTIFKSHKVLKTILALIVINFVVSAISNGLLVGLLFSNLDMDFSNMAMDDLKLFVKTSLIVGNVFNAIIVTGLFVWTYFRLKRMKY